MMSPALERLTADVDDDLPRSPALQAKAPALVEAFQGERMKAALEDTLLGARASSCSIVDCVPGKALYLPDRIINMQYKLGVQDRSGGPIETVLVNARLYPDLPACRSYLEQALQPIAARIGMRRDIERFEHPVAVFEPLNMALSVFPIDGLNPTLAEAADPDTIAGVLASALPEAASGRMLIKEVRLLLAHYGRYKRCVLRYSIDGQRAEDGSAQNMIVYGKVDADGLGGVTEPIIEALRDMLQRPGLRYPFRIPQSLGYFPDLRLLLMEALPGKPFFKELLKTWTGAESQAGSAPVTLEQAVASCALIAATLHGSGIKLGPLNTLEAQVAKLRDEAAVLGEVFPELGAQIASWIDQTVAFARAYPAMPPCFSHGDFTYTQLIFDGAQGGLVDFDSICQAEPAQDLGHYLAYQRLNIIKDQDPNAPFAPEAIERLCALFMDAYLAASRSWIPDEAQLKGRAAIYELISLIRLALHSWEKMKGSRLKQTLALLEERIECQKQIS